MDGLPDKDKAEEEVDGIEPWELDTGGKYAMRPDTNGDYELVDAGSGVYQAINGKGATLRRMPVQPKEKKDGEDRVEAI